MVIYYVKVIPCTYTFVIKLNVLERERYDIEVMSVENIIKFFEVR